MVSRRSLLTAPILALAGTAATKLSAFGSYLPAQPTEDAVAPSMTTGAGQTDPNRSYDLIHRATCIRLGTGGPVIYTNAVHGNIGVTKVGMNTSGDLVVYTDWVLGEVLIYAGVAVDMTLGAKGVTCGVSGGGPKSTIRLVDGKGVRHHANSSYFDINVDNVWFHAITMKPRSLS